MNEVLQRHARILKDSPLLDLVFKEIEELYVERWRSGESVKVREEAYAGITSCTELKEVLDDRIREYAGDGTDSTGDGA